MLKIVDVLTNIIAIIPRVIALLGVVAEIAKKVADALESMGKPKTGE